jgi:hypothetical protein
MCTNCLFSVDFIYLNLLSPSFLFPCSCLWVLMLILVLLRIYILSSNLVKNVGFLMHVSKVLISSFHTPVFVSTWGDSSVFNTHLWQKLVVLTQFNPLKTEFLHNLIYKFSLYLTGSTLHLRYKNEPVDAVWGNCRCLL